MPASPSSSLLDIARLIDDCLGDDPADLAFAVVDHPTEVVLEVLHLRDHPCVALAGLVAPPRWRAFGVRVQSRAHFLDRPDQGPESVITTFLCDRSGTSASLLRRECGTGEVTQLAEGRVPDLCRRILSTDGAATSS